MDTAIEAMKLGAYDYISKPSKPFKPDEIILTLKKVEERERLRRENISLKREIRREYSFGNIIAKSSGMREILNHFRIFPLILFSAPCRRDFAAPCR